MKQAILLDRGLQVRVTEDYEFEPLIKIVTLICCLIISSHSQSTCNFVMSVSSDSNTTDVLAEALQSAFDSVSHENVSVSSSTVALDTVRAAPSQPQSRVAAVDTQSQRSSGDAVEALPQLPYREADISVLSQLPSLDAGNVTHPQLPLSDAGRSSKSQLPLRDAENFSSGRQPPKDEAISLLPESSTFAVSTSQEGEVLKNMFFTEPPKPSNPGPRFENSWAREIGGRIRRGYDPSSVTSVYPIPGHSFCLPPIWSAATDVFTRIFKTQPGKYREVRTRDEELMKLQSAQIAALGPMHELTVLLGLGGSCRPPVKQEISALRVQG